MAFHTVNLQKCVSGESLEQACIKATEELSYKAESQDEFSRSYTLGSVHPQNDYKETRIRIGGILPALQVQIKKGKQQNYFFINTGFPHGFASEKRVQEYLSAVSKYL